MYSSCLLQFRIQPGIDLRIAVPDIKFMISVHIIYRCYSCELFYKCSIRCLRFLRPRSVHHIPETDDQIRPDLPDSADYFTLILSDHPAMQVGQGCDPESSGRHVFWMNGYKTGSYDEHLAADQHQYQDRCDQQRKEYCSFHNRETSLNRCAFSRFMSSFFITLHLSYTVFCKQLYSHAVFFAHGFFRKCFS